MKTLKKVLLTSAVVFFMIAARAQDVGISLTASIAPPPLPVYVQPPCPVDGYIWTPGYWAFNAVTGNYYWVPGVWVDPPAPGFLWTPPYWGFVNGVYGFHRGYWGLHVGFYGGINYGCGYTGVGFVGGRWVGKVFHYNTAVVNVNKTVVHNVYVDKTVINRNETASHLSYNGTGGVTAKPTRDEVIAMKQDRKEATKEQEAHVNNASTDNDQFVSRNHGNPEKMSMDRIGGDHFNHRGERLQKRK